MPRAAISIRNPYAPPRTEVSGPPRSMELASRGTRLLARCLDALLLACGYGLVVLSGVGKPGAHYDRATALLGIAGVLALWALATCNCVLLRRTGQTLGKLALGIQIVRHDGTRASLPRLLFLRSGINTVLALIPLFGWACLLVNALMILGESRRCLHDRIAGTLVVIRGSVPADLGPESIA